MQIVGLDLLEQILDLRMVGPDCPKHFRILEPDGWCAAADRSERPGCAVPGLDRYGLGRGFLVGSAENLALDLFGLGVGFAHNEGPDSLWAVG